MTLLHSFEIISATDIFSPCQREDGHPSPSSESQKSKTEGTYSSTMMLDADRDAFSCLVKVYIYI